MTNLLTKQGRTLSNLTAIATNQLSTKVMLTEALLESELSQAERKIRMDEADRLQSEFAGQSAEQNNRFRELQLKQMEWNNKVALLQKNNTQLAILLAKAKWAVFLALGWTVSGFILWYQRVQVYQDRILRNEADRIAPKKTKAKKDD